MGVLLAATLLDIAKVESRRTRATGRATGQGYEAAGGVGTKV